MEAYQNTAETTAVAATEAPLTMDYVLSKIEAIRMDTAHLHEAIAALQDTPAAAGPGDIAGQEKAKALGDIVRCREATNQQLLKLYEKMYDDLQNKNKADADSDIRHTMLNTVTNITTLCDDMDELPHILEQLGSIFDTLRFIG